MRHKKQKSNKLPAVAVFVLIFLIGGGYICVANGLTAKGFKVRELEKKVQVLNEENGKLELQVAESQAITNVKSKIGSTDMIRVDRYDYIEVDDTSVARK